MRGYIYGIFIKGSLAYVGKTTRSPQERWAEHESYVKDKTLKHSQQNHLYEAMRINKYEFKILYEGNFDSNYELETKEKILIEELQPRYNWEGVKAPYRYSNQKMNKEWWELHTIEGEKKLWQLF